MTEPIDGSKEAMNLREDPSYPLEDSSFPTGDPSFPTGDPSFPLEDSSFPHDYPSFLHEDSSFPPAKTKETQAHTISLLNLPPPPSAPSRGKSNNFERFFGD